MLQLDPNRPIYSPAETYVDLFVSYRTKLFRDKVGATFQLNVRNVGESGGDRLLVTSQADLAHRIAILAMTEAGDAIRDAIEGRILNGLHFRHADEQGAWIGKKAAQWLEKHEFQPVD